MPSITCGKALEEATLEAGFCAQEIPISINKPRSIVSVGNDEFLVFERTSSSVLRVYDSNADGLPDAVVNVGASGGNHGMAYHDGYLYISNDSTVWRWRYEIGSNMVSSDEETVVVNINKDGQGGAPQGHTTRTLAFDDQGRLYISVGSGGNVDANSYRARIRRLFLSNATLPLDFQQGEVFADGLRNEVGLAFDRHGVLWGVENGPDNLKRSDLGGDIHYNNPGEELNRFPESLVASNWGYPQCWTEYDLDDGEGRGTVWLWPSFQNEGWTDAKCRADSIPPELSMQAHSAPLGIAFYNYTEDRPDGCNGAFPESMDGYAFIAFHGSWNRDVPTGYKVVYVPMSSEGRVNATDPSDLLLRASPNAPWSSGYRPVDVDFDACGRLLVTSDGSGDDGRGSSVVRIAYGSDACCGGASRGINMTSAGMPTVPGPGNLFWIVTLTTLIFRR